MTHLQQQQQHNNRRTALPHELLEVNQSIYLCKARSPFVSKPPFDCASFVSSRGVKACGVCQERPSSCCYTLACNFNHKLGAPLNQIPELDIPLGSTEPNILTPVGCLGILSSPHSCGISPLTRKGAWEMADVPSTVLQIRADSISVLR